MSSFNFTIDTNILGGSTSTPDLTMSAGNVGDDGGSRVHQTIVHVDASEAADGEITTMGGDGGDILPRRWSAGRTDRLNQSSWCGARPSTINEDLELYMTQLVTRCRHEAETNGNVKGMSETHTIALLGETGPTMTVESDDEAWNKDLIEQWEEWWESPTVDGMHGLDLMRRHNRGEWTDGKNLCQIVDFANELPSSNVVTHRLLDISPDRLINPPTGDRRTVLGINRDKWGRPRTYYIADPSEQFSRFDYLYTNFQPREIPASDIIHYFDSIEPGQATGVPRLACTLQDCADLREYDNEVLDAARAAANNAVLLYTTQPEHVRKTSRIKAGTEMALKRRTAKVLPAGYQATSQAPAHPSAMYIEFRHEKLRSIGRSCHMPLLLILLSAEGSNFSQSRIDVNVLYERGLQMTRGCRERNFLTPLAKQVVRAKHLATRETKSGPIFRFRRPPRRFRIGWNWEPMAQANPKDAMLAVERAMALGLTTYEMELAKRNLRLDDVIASRVRSDKALQAQGLPTITDMIAALNNMQGDADEQANSDAQPKPVAKTKKNVTVKPSSRSFLPPSLVY